MIWQEANRRSHALTVEVDAGNKSPEYSARLGSTHSGRTATSATTRLDNDG